MTRVERKTKKYRLRYNISSFIIGKALSLSGGPKLERIRREKRWSLQMNWHRKKNRTLRGEHAACAKQDIVDDAAALPETTNASKVILYSFACFYLNKLETAKTNRAATLLLQYAQIISRFCVVPSLFNGRNQYFWSMHIKSPEAWS